MNETELRAPVEKLFPLSQYIVGTEVPFGLKRIDLVFKERRNSRQLIAIELKIRDWKKALWQAVHYRQVATFSYIALLDKHVCAVDREILSSQGLGLIAVNTRGAKILRRAKKSRYVNKRLAKQVASYIESSHV